MSYKSKLFLLGKVTCSCNCLITIIIIYLKPNIVYELLLRYRNIWYYMTKLCVLRIVTRNCNCLIKIIISYLKPYNCVQIKNYYQKEIITRNHIKVYKLFVIYCNILYYMTKLCIYRIVTWCCNCLIRISHLKPYICANKWFLLIKNNDLKPCNY